jgi:DNA/RNA-binding domain of Phe-tRNA-synthetase-like protein
MNEEELGPRVILEESLRDRVRTLVLWIDDVLVLGSRTAYGQLEAVAHDYAKKYEGLTVGKVEGVAEARRLYRAFNIDPTSTRPSSEALLKRALKRSELYHLNNVVDMGNAASLSTLLPLGLYDRKRIVGETVTIRAGHEGEEYPGIRKGPVHVAGRLCVADGEGAFGSPTSDSVRTSITESSTELLIIVFAPADGEITRLQGAGDLLEKGFAEHCGGRTIHRQILPSPA